MPGQYTHNNLFDQRPVDTQVIDGRPNAPAYPVQASVGDILLDIRKQLVDANAWDQGTVHLSLVRHPKLNVFSDTYGVLVPGGILADQRMAAGGGRKTTVLTLDLEVWCYLRLNLDDAYQNTQMLTADDGLRSKVQQVSTALQMYLPSDNLGNALAIEPIRLKDEDRPELAWKSKDFVAQALLYEVRYSAKLS